ncbi:putative histone deacetylase HOS3 [Rosellinia necatrix]|uniref:Putative histone deacetylase HOS3 n=1 Tax=Rosellinia necatrix TaxID=77044 RepID=A0A1S8A5Z5_ROSNE|nr:putative histone deacetylase HOS3 [Rosellinia necatrix]
MTKNPRVQSSVAVTAFENADNPPVDTKSFFTRNLHYVSCKPGVESSWHVHFVPLHASALPLARIEPGRQKDGGFWHLTSSLKPFGLRPKIISCLFENNRILGCVELPEFRISFPLVQVHIPYVLSMSVVNTQTGVLDFLFVTVFTRIRVDIVNAEVSDRGLFPCGDVLNQSTLIVLPSDGLGAVPMINQTGMRQSSGVPGVARQQTHVCERT